eukprot:SAG22_NODE_6706_length_821_cov_1.684211_1_plen_150_part_00
MRECCRPLPNTTTDLDHHCLLTAADHGGLSLSLSRRENTFLAQAFDLDDKWGPGGGPCQTDASKGGWGCCEYSWGLAGKCAYNATACAGREAQCAPACASAQTRSVMGGIHPRWKKPVGDRLGIAAFNTVYGGSKVRRKAHCLSAVFRC